MTPTKHKRLHGQYLLKDDIVVLEAKITQDADPLETPMFHHMNLVTVTLQNGLRLIVPKQALRRRNVPTETRRCNECSADMTLDLYKQVYVCTKCDNWKQIV